MAIPTRVARREHMLRINRNGEVERRKHRNICLRQILVKIEPVEMDQVDHLTVESDINRLSVIDRFDQLTGNPRPAAGFEDVVTSTLHQIRMQNRRELFGPPMQPLRRRRQGRRRSPHAATLWRWIMM
jgi:hypothetical protein